LFPAGTVNITSNGYVVAGAATGASNYVNGLIDSTYNGTLFGYGVNDKVICPWWDDLYAVALPDSTIYWQEINGVLYVLWKNIGHFITNGGPTGPSITFEVQIVQKTCGTSIIHMVYPDTVFGGAQAANDNGASATVGYVGGTPALNGLWS